MTHPMKCVSFSFFQDGYCHSKNITEKVKLSGFVNVPPNDVNALKIAIAKHGPISISIDASHRTFSFYAHGVYYDPTCGKFFSFSFEVKLQ